MWWLNLILISWIITVFFSFDKPAVLHDCTLICLNALLNVVVASSHYPITCYTHGPLDGVTVWLKQCLHLRENIKCFSTSNLLTELLWLVYLIWTSLLVKKIFGICSTLLPEQKGWTVPQVHTYICTLSLKMSHVRNYASMDLEYVRAFRYIEKKTLYTY